MTDQVRPPRFTVYADNDRGAPFPETDGSQPCTSVDPELFFPTDTSRVSKSLRAMCGTCPVQRGCLEYALDRPKIVGIWGGSSERQRSLARKRISWAREKGPEAAKEMRERFVESMTEESAA